MGTANSDNAATNQTVDNFFGVVDSTLGGNYGDVAYLVNSVFCPDDLPNPTRPSVGITDHGPNFIGKQEIRGLFTQLFTSFPTLRIQQIPNSQGRFFSRDGQTTAIGIRATFSGEYQAPWFKKDKGKGDKKSHYSKPLSDIAIHSASLMSTTIPMFLVFTFGDPSHTSQISQASMYLDRYRFIADLTPPVTP